MRLAVFFFASLLTLAFARDKDYKRPPAYAKEGIRACYGAWYGKPILMKICDQWIALYKQDPRMDKCLHCAQMCKRALIENNFEELCAACSREPCERLDDAPESETSDEEINGQDASDVEGKGKDEKGNDEDDSDEEFKAKRRAWRG